MSILGHITCLANSCITFAVF